MTKDLRKRLEDKGWEPEYIEKAVSVIEENNKARGSIITKLDRLVYWIAMIVAIVGNFIISIILVPFLVSITNKIALGIIIFCIAMSFGFLFNVLLRDIKEIDSQHYIVSDIFIPALALINTFVITNVANHFINLLNIQTAHNPVYIGVIYVSGFVIPYLADKFFNKEKIIKKEEILKQTTG